VELGLYVEVLNEPFTCFDASLYGTLLLADPEDYFSMIEIEKLRRDLEAGGLSIVILAEWFNEEIMHKNEFFNNNTFERWSPFMAGGNILALNELLAPYHVAFGERVFSGDFQISKKQVLVDSSTELIRFPRGGYLVSALLNEESSHLIANGMQYEESILSDDLDVNIETNRRYAPVLGLVDGLPGMPNSGKIAVFTDTSCLDSVSASVSKCFWLFKQIMQSVVYDSKTLFEKKY